MPGYLASKFPRQGPQVFLDCDDIFLVLLIIRHLIHPPNSGDERGVGRSTEMNPFYRPSPKIISKLHRQ